MTNYSYGWGDSPEQRSFEGSGEDWPGEPQHGDSGTCGVCGGEIEFIEETKTSKPGADGVEILNAWWAHRAHPQDNHDATLGGPA